MSDRQVPIVIRSPFPWFGGKSRAADLIWSRLGNVANYIEPFAGSLAVLLARPHEPKTETINDLDAMVANFWRSVQAAPDEVARWTDGPVNEADLHARHRWLVAQLPGHRARMEREPDYFDPKIAGWWVWGLCQWIGTGWCAQRTQGGHGCPPDSNLPASPPIQLPHLGNTGRGVHRKIPHLGDAGRGGLTELFQALQERLRRVRVACGDFERVLGDSVTWRHGLTGILLDPPYAEGEMEYSSQVDGVAKRAAEWARANGGNPLLRVALCGLDGEHDMPGWTCVPWKVRGGYGSQRADGSNNNRKRERIWFSPHCLCLDKGQIALFPKSSNDSMSKESRS